MRKVPGKTRCVEREGSGYRQARKSSDNNSEGGNSEDWRRWRAECGRAGQRRRDESGTADAFKCHGGDLDQFCEKRKTTIIIFIDKATERSNYDYYFSILISNYCFVS